MHFAWAFIRRKNGSASTDRAVTAITKKEVKWCRNKAMVLDGVSVFEGRCVVFLVYEVVGLCVGSYQK